MTNSLNFLAVFAFAAMTGAACAEDLGTMRGIVRSVDEAWLSSDLGVAISKLPFKEGDAFKAGDTLVAFDCANVESQLKAQKARLAGETTMFKNNQQLKDRNAGGQFDVDLARAKVDEASAQVEELGVTLKRCVIAAPFPGKMADLGVHIHETPERGQRIMRIIDTTALEVDMILPSDWLKWLSPPIKQSIQLSSRCKSARSS